MSVAETPLLQGTWPC